MKAHDNHESCKCHKCRSWLESFRYALNGIGQTAKTERNFRIHIVMGMLAVIVCVVFRAYLDVWHFVLVALAIFFVMVMELMNTAIEAITDLVCGNSFHPLAKMAKDAAAGAVLLASTFALVVGAVVAITILRRFL